MATYTTDAITGAKLVERGMVLDEPDGTVRVKIWLAEVESEDEQP